MKNKRHKDEDKDWEDIAKHLPAFKDTPSEFKRAYHLKVKNIVENLDIEEKRNKTEIYDEKKVKRLQSELLCYSKQYIGKKTKTIPFFVFKNDPFQSGDGYYEMTACFFNLGIHVPFKIYCHSENEYLEVIGKPTSCDDDLCTHRYGSIINYYKKRRHDDFSVNEIVKKVLDFLKKK